jgi:hypothetical protein
LLFNNKSIPNKISYQRKSPPKRAFSNACVRMYKDFVYTKA